MILRSASTLWSRWSNNGVFCSRRRIANERAAAGVADDVGLARLQPEEVLCNDTSVHACDNNQLKKRISDLGDSLGYLSRFHLFAWGNKKTGLAQRSRSRSVCSIEEVCA